jgi:hypothetical protein
MVCHQVDDTDLRTPRLAPPVLVDNGGCVWAHTRPGPRMRQSGRQRSPRATVKPRDVRNGDADHRRGGLRRSCHRLAAGQLGGWEHP